MYLDQQMYIDELKEVQICKDGTMSKEIPLYKEEPGQLRGLAGQLKWTQGWKN